MKKRYQIAEKESMLKGDAVKAAEKNQNLLTLSVGRGFVRKLMKHSAPSFFHSPSFTCFNENVPRIKYTITLAKMAL